MADIPQTAALIVVAQEYRGDIIPQINRRATALRVLPIRPGSGQNVAEVAEGDGAIAEAYSDGDDATNFGADAEAPAIWKWGLYRGLFRVTSLARQIAETSTTPEGLRHLVGRNMVNAMRKLASELNTAIHTGSGAGNSIAGFSAALATDNTYGTIDRTDSANAYWRSNVFDPGSLTALTLAQIRKDLGAIYDASGEQPDIAFVSTDVHNTVASLFESTRRYIQDIVTARGPIKLDAGYEAIEVNGCMFLKDKDVPANTIEYVNSNYVELQYLRPSVAVMAALESMGVEMPIDDGYGPIPLGVNWEKLAKLGASDRYQGITTCSLKVARPNACGLRKNVAVVS